MTEVFLKICELNLSTGGIILVILTLRLFFHRVSKRVICMLWGMSALRLIFPLYWSAPDGFGGSLSELFSHIHRYTSATRGDTESTYFTTVITLEVIWLVGIAFISICELWSIFRLRRCIRVSVPLEQNIFFCDSICSPFVWGLLRPQIYLPSIMTEVDLQFVLAHERAHIKRRDHWWKMLACSLLIVYWMNPLIWVAFYLFSRDIELACDETVIAELSDIQRISYAQAILNYSPRSVDRLAAYPSLGMVGVKTRIKQIMKKKKKSGLWTVILLMIGLIVGLTFFIDTSQKPIDYTDRTDDELIEFILEDSHFIDLFLSNDKVRAVAFFEKKCTALQHLLSRESANESLRKHIVKGGEDGFVNAKEERDIDGLRIIYQVNAGKKPT